MQVRDVAGDKVILLARVVKIGVDRDQRILDDEVADSVLADAAAVGRGL